MKSIYLNNSKYSNNLRHTLRIFFEREVKTKYTPMIFGSTFKGSKWVDYQTFNINKLFIKSGLSYFYYIITLITILFVFLGRSKSEQYFGFLPLFSYFNFILGYIPLVFSDTISQLILIIYILYISAVNLSYNIINKLSNNTLVSIENKLIISSDSLPTVSTKKSISNFNNLFNNSIQTIPFFSKTLSKVNQNLHFLNKYSCINKSNQDILNTSNVLKNQVNLLTILVKKPTYSINNTLSVSESFYSNLQHLNNFKIKNTQINLNNIYKFNNLTRLPASFSFNLENNLNIAKQSRWLTRNSLLSEAIVPNSFLITQAKKLIGLGFLDKDFTDKSLWLPTKSSKLSSIESLNYFTNLSNQVFSKTNSKTFLQLNKIQNSEFFNLNFFENSRLWLFKKYFFNNNQVNNMVIDLPKILKTNTHRNELNLSNFTIYNYLNNVAPLLRNNLTPSLNYIEANKSFTHHLINNSQTNQNISLSIAPIDVLSGTNINLFYIITSNPHNSTMFMTNYYNNILSSSNYTLNSTDNWKIKFYR